MLVKKLVQTVLTFYHVLDIVELLIDWQLLL